MNLIQYMISFIQGVVWIPQHHSILKVQICFRYANNMRLTHSEFVIDEINLDVLGHEMMPVVHFPWVEIRGKLKSGMSDSLPQKSDFRYEYLLYN